MQSACKDDDYESGGGDDDETSQVLADMMQHKLRINQYAGSCVGYELGLAIWAFSVNAAPDPLIHCCAVGPAILRGLYSDIFGLTALAYRVRWYPSLYN